jgi:two-component system KDP operon response regulator KdpE
MRAVLRRRSEDGDAPVRVGDLEVDLADRSVRRAGEEVHLTPIEFDLLSQLARHPGRLITHRQLLNEVWGPGYEDETHYLRVHFAHIRAKLEPDRSNPTFVITEPGIGYRLREDL